MVLRRVPFHREIISNGVLRGVRRAQLAFQSQGTLAEIYVRNGSRVKAGDPIARLDTVLAGRRLAEARNAMEKARLDFYDNLISYGYGKDTSDVPSDMVEVARIRSGYAAAGYSYDEACRNLQNSILRAPFSGVVANLEKKPYEQTEGTLCMVIDDSSFDVKFNLIESELSSVAVGRPVSVSPLFDTQVKYDGSVSYVNPFVDEKGQVSAGASVRGGSGLVDGMNVRVYLKSEGENMLVVPKSAVVMRDGYDVVFTYDPSDGKAHWLYVDILQSNSTHHVIGGCVRKQTEVREGCIVISSGNLNLADQSSVELRK